MNKFKFFGIAVLVVAIGFAFTSCASPEITISGNPQVGSTITATSQNGDFTGNFSWQVSAIGGQYNWSNAIIGIGHNRVFGSNNQNLEIGTGFGAGMAGRFLRASRRTGGGDTVFSNVIGPIVGY
ncbi:MAG: hypothetical protein FWC64_02555 [Treponema sp.]|nr:hypothetical protein [Treponema sp.]